MDPVTARRIPPAYPSGRGSPTRGYVPSVRRMDLTSATSAPDDLSR